MLFVQLDAEAALKAAKKADEAQAHSSSELAPLHGLPITIKDAIDIICD